MTWFKVDDRLPDHVKVRKAGTSAIGLWTLAGAWSSGNLTDGFVPKDIAKRWDPNGRLAAKLVSSGLWDKAEKDDESGYQFHQWKEQNPLRADVLARRQAAAERVARHRKNKETRNEDVSNDVGNALHDELPTESVTPPPTRPDPTRPEKKEETAPGKPDAAEQPKASKPVAIEQATAAAAYERIGKAGNFMAIRGIAKWAIHDRGEDPATVEEAVVAVYGMGKPITKTVVGQYLDGLIGRQGAAGGISRQDAKVQSYLDYANGPEARKAIG